MFLQSNKIPNFEKFSIFITIREWGYSKWDYMSFNLWLKSWDDPEKVFKNRKILGWVLWKKPENFIFLNQVHGSDVLVLETKSEDKWSWEYDAVITDNHRIIPIILIADCVPIVVFDEITGVFWVVHSGWRGTAQDILWKTIEKMQEGFWCDVWNIQVIIWPCISARNYEVDSQVIDNFDSDFYIENSRGWYQLDLRKIVNFQAIQAWVLEKNVEDISICTFKEEDMFFSARRDWFSTGRFAMWIYAK